MKHILFIINYFYPDYASTGQIMTELCEKIQYDYDITVIAAFPNYANGIPEKYKGKRFVYEKYQNIKIIRVKVPEFNKTKKASRIKYIMEYFINAFLAIFKADKPDIIFSISQPPILGGILGVLGKVFRKAKFIYNIQDFNPEQIEAIKYSRNRFIINLMRKIDNFSCNMADNIVVVGRDMRETLISRNKSFNNKKCTVINNWINEKEIYPLDKTDVSVSSFIEKNGLKDKFIIMYSGNIGLYYDLENIIKIVPYFNKYPDMMFVFIGEGAKKDEIINYCNKNNISNVRFLPYQPKERIIYSLNAADIHLVTNSKGIKGVSVPSKIYGVMAVGKPILGILEPGSEARNLIEDSKCGVCVDPANYEMIKNKIEYLYMNKEKIREMGLRGRKYLEENLTMDKSINKYKELLDNI
ncbi:glycosyltransferase family 4 protein [Calorimonas adulescens]|uniref:Glycosyltransferase family 4 protein n=1 Tax=Calorimonas adulescens TaxID=2606906 RepID=A0A5D8QF86_9THEO|nr:glycosyltransferase family 4 protein [Calorimonas adulescens]TZE83077.1 glycosyltransferase family 4 protein [Calorimonas adulescens]